MRPNYSSLHRKLALVSKLKLCLQKIYRNLHQLILGTFLFAHSLHAGLLSGQSDRTGGLLTERLFSMMHDFRQSSEAVGLPQVSKMLRQFTRQISAHYSTFKIRNIHLRLFRPDQGPYTVFPFSEQKGPITIPFGVARRPIWLI